MIKKIDNGKLRYGITLGWQIARLEMIFKSDFKDVIEEIEFNIKEMLEFENLKFEYDDPRELIRKTNNYYSYHDIEKHTAILLGICVFRLSLTVNIKIKEELKTELEDIAFSAIQDIDSELIFDKTNFFKKLREVKPQNIVETLDLINEISIGIKEINIENETYVYDVAFSFASENRNYVENTANFLKQLGFKIFYDKYEQTDLWGKDLYQHLNSIYQHKARYCVIFISKQYSEKLWTKHELKSAQSRAFEENREYILPVRFDDTELPGLNKTIGYIDLNNMLPSELAEIIKIKIS